MERGNEDAEMAEGDKLIYWMLSHHQPVSLLTNEN
jgi:hypothetical protein